MNCKISSLYICVKDMEACLKGVEGANQSFDQIYGDVEKAAE